MKQNKRKKQQFFLHGVGHSTFSKVTMCSSLITIIISLITFFYELPKFVVFTFILILIIQPLIIVFINDHSKYK